MAKSQGQEPNFDEILTKLRSSVEQLESGQLSLEQSLVVYEQGVKLAKQAQVLLDAAQKRVDLLSASGDVPFEGDE